MASVEQFNQEIDKDSGDFKCELAIPLLKQNSKGYDTKRILSQLNLMNYELGTFQVDSIQLNDRFNLTEIGTGKKVGRKAELPSPGFFTVEESINL